MGPARTTRRLRRIALSAIVASVVTPGLPAAAGLPVAKGTSWSMGRAAPTADGTMHDVIVQVRGRSTRAVAAAVRAAGGTVDKDLPVVNGFSAHVPARALAALRARADVRAVSENSAVRFATTGYDDTTVASNFAKSTGAPAAWSAGNLGEGVGVAVIDTGISPMKDFTGRLVHGPDLSGEGTIIDSYGHGTVMGGIVGGSGADSASNAGGSYAGVAPKSTLVAVKVAGRNGAADVSTMLQAMHWVSAYKNQFNIRVLNLSWGTTSSADPAHDPVNYAVERLWKQGIVVVVAAGNAGPNSGTITKPADDPMVISVGAYNDGGNLDPADDSVPGWSSRGPTAQGLSKPDVVAPGRTLVAARSFGSHVEANNPKALIPPSYIKGSGTSQAAAVVSGLAALLVKANPHWTPDQVKHALRSTAAPIAGVGANTQGKGRVSYAAAAKADVSSAPVQSSNASGLGSLEASRANIHVWADCKQDGTLTYIQGEVDVWCQPWNGAAWNGAAWNGDSWTGETWAGAAWNGAAWNGAAWNGAAWNGAAWNGAAWNGEAWTTAGYGEDDLYLTAFFGARPKYGHHVPGEVSEPRGAARAAGDDD